MIIAREFDILRAGDPFRHVPSVFDSHGAITRAVNDERGNADRIKDMSGVDVAIHPEQRFDRSGTGALTLVAGKPFAKGRIVGEARRESLVHRTSTPCLAHPGDERLEFFLRSAPRVVGRPRGTSKAPVEHERRRSLGIGCSEEQGHRAPLGDAQQCGPLGSDGVHDCAHVVHALFERGDRCRTIGQTSASLVELDHARKRLQSLGEPRESRLLHEMFDV